MESRHNGYDVTETINVTEVEPVCREVCRLYGRLYPEIPTGALRQAFADTGRLFRGHYPGYLPCETPYHDLQHTLDVTLAMARLLYGYERSRQDGRRIGPRRGLLGLICALFHDAGYIRRTDGEHHGHGAELTRQHVSRSAVFLDTYLSAIGLGQESRDYAELLHFTGYEKSAAEVDVDDPDLRLIGKMVGAADFLAQMADRCYLEKCRDRLYPEFVASGMAAVDQPAGGYASGEELLRKTPEFFRHVLEERLPGDYDGVHRYLEHCFGTGRNPYMETIRNHRAHLEAMVDRGDMSKLRRRPAWTLNRDIPPPDISRYLQ